MDSQITFGTSGHRGIIGENFSQKHVWAITQAVADYLEENKLSPSLIIGYDPREGNDPMLEEGSYTRIIVETLLERGIKPFFCKSYTPTPVISWAIRHQTIGGGLILTASHNPPDYNGIKFNPYPGQPAPVEITTGLQEKANRYMRLPFKEINTDLADSSMERIDPIPAFSKDVIATCKSLIPFPEPPSLSVAIDTKYGACATTWKALFSESSSSIRMIHAEPRSDFGNINPNPTYIPGLVDLQAQKTDLSFANDPDGDRHILLDESGTPLTPEITTLVIADYLLSLGHILKGIASTLASSAIIKSFTDFHNIEFHEEKVGFKYMFPFLETCLSQNKLGLAVESSGGFTLSSHTYEKCGFLPCMLVLYICSHSKKPLSDHVAHIKATYGSFTFQEESFEYPSENKAALIDCFNHLETSDIQSIINGEITVDMRDGVKLSTDKGWVLFRFSGTEPIIRLYAESQDDRYVETLIQKAKTFISTKISG